LPLFPLHPLLTHIITYVSDNHPRLFERLGEYSQRTFAIEPTDLPFVFMLQPDPAYPVLEACRSLDEFEYDAKISGTLFTLLDMVEGRIDGDAIFFSRELLISGDTEAVVALRNAIDDTEGNLIDEITDSFGPLSLPMGAAVSIYRSMRERKFSG
jgi:predicted lipid carrier protein YhbT